MKYIPFLEIGQLKGKSVIENALAFAGERGIPFEEMRKRSRLWDKIDANTDPDGIELEDADADSIIELVKRTPFAAASRELVRVIASIVDAKERPAVKLPAKAPPAARAKNGHADPAQPNA